VWTEDEIRELGEAFVESLRENLRREREQGRLRE
jgi:hypothetical protein